MSLINGSANTCDDCLTGKTPNGPSIPFVQPSTQKYFASRWPQIRFITAMSSPHRGVSWSSRTRGGMRWTRQRQAWSGIAGRVFPWATTSRRRAAHVRTAKPCGPGTRCWCQVGGVLIGPTGSGETSIRRWRRQERIRLRGELGI